MGHEGRPDGGASGAKTSSIAASEAPGRERHLTARRKQEAVLRILRGVPLEAVAREVGAIGKDVAAGLILRHDHGTQYMSHGFQNQIRWLGIA